MDTDGPVLRQRKLGRGRVPEELRVKLDNEDTPEVMTQEKLYHELLGEVLMELRERGHGRGLERYEHMHEAITMMPSGLRANIPMQDMMTLYEYALAESHSLVEFYSQRQGNVQKTNNKLRVWALLFMAANLLSLILNTVL